MMRLAVLTCGLLFATGCAGRMIVSVEDAPVGGATIIKTLDSQSYVLWGFTKTVWCRRRKGQALSGEQRQCADLLGARRGDGALVASEQRLDG